MGIFRLTSYLRKHRIDVCDHVILGNVAKLSHGGSLLLLIDGLNWIIQRSVEDQRPFLPGYRRFRANLRDFVQTLRDQGIETAWYFDASSGSAVSELKRKTSIDRKMQSIEKISRWQEIIDNGDRLDDQWLPSSVEPAAMAVSAGMDVLRELDCPIVICCGEADFQLAVDAARPNVYAIVSGDSDFFFQPSVRFIPLYSLRILRGDASYPSIQADVFTYDRVANALGIPLGSLPALACLCGNDYTKPLLENYTEGLTHLRRNSIQAAIEWIQKVDDSSLLDDPCFLETSGSGNKEWCKAVRLTYLSYLDPQEILSSERIALNDESGRAGMVREAVVGGLISRSSLNVVSSGYLFTSISYEALDFDLPSSAECVLPLTAAMISLLIKNASSHPTSVFLRRGMQYTEVSTIDCLLPPWFLKEEMPSIPVSSHCRMESRLQWLFDPLWAFRRVLAPEVFHSDSQSTPRVELVQVWLSERRSEALTFGTISLIYLIASSAYYLDPISETEFKTLVLMIATLLGQSCENEDMTRALKEEELLHGEPLLRASTLSSRLQTIFSRLYDICRIANVLVGVQKGRLYEGPLLERLLPLVSSCTISWDPAVLPVNVPNTIMNVIEEYCELDRSIVESYAFSIARDALRLFGGELPTSVKGDMTKEAVRDAPLPHIMPSSAMNVLPVTAHREAIVKSIVNNPVTRDAPLPRVMPSSAMNVLPVTAHREAIVKSIMNNPVTIIKGETGCGKSSGIPQFIMEDCPHKLIVSTQPRRVAATALAKFVAERRGEPMGCTVGYSIGNNLCVDKGEKKTTLRFVTTGWLLHKLLAKPEFIHRCSHILLDEVHERTVDMDLLCLLLKEFILNFKLDLRLVLMSATFDGSKYKDYFNIGQDSIPTLYVGSMCFPVKEVFLDELDRYMDAQASLSKQFSRKLQVGVHNSRTQRIGKNIPSICQATNKIAVELCHALVERHAEDEYGFSILLFLPGFDALDELYCLFMDEIKEKPLFEKHMELIVMHGMLDHEELMCAFNPIAAGVTRVVMATNIAESSVTVPWCRYVIDFGLVKQMWFDTRAKKDVLKLTWISKASAAQRAGRCGRQFPGVAFRLYTRSLYEELDEYDAVEIVRLSLDGTILLLKDMVRFSMDTVFSHPRRVLNKCLQPPEEENITAAVDALLESGALIVPERCQLCERDRDSCECETIDSSMITVQGEIIRVSSLPLQLGRLVAFGARTGKFLPHTLIAALGMSSPLDVFSKPSPFFGDHQKYINRTADVVSGKIWLDGGRQSDPIAYCQLLLEYCSKNSSELIRLGLHKNRLRAFATSVSHTAARLSDFFPELSSYLEPLRSLRSAGSRTMLEKALDLQSESSCNVLRLLLALAFSANGVLLGTGAFKNFSWPKHVDLLRTFQLAEVPERLQEMGGFGLLPAGLIAKTESIVIDSEKKNWRAAKVTHPKDGAGGKRSKGNRTISLRMAFNPDTPKERPERSGFLGDGADVPASGICTWLSLCRRGRLVIPLVPSHDGPDGAPEESIEMMSFECVPRLSLRYTWKPIPPCQNVVSNASVLSFLQPVSPEKNVRNVVAIPCQFCIVETKEAQLRIYDELHIIPEHNGLLHLLLLCRRIPGLAVRCAMSECTDEDCEVHGEGGGDHSCGSRRIIVGFTVGNRGIALDHMLDASVMHDPSLDRLLSTLNALWHPTEMGIIGEYLEESVSAAMDLMKKNFRPFPSSLTKSARIGVIESSQSDIELDPHFKLLAAFPRDTKKIPIEPVGIREENAESTRTDSIESPLRELEIQAMLLRLGLPPHTARDSKRRWDSVSDLWLSLFPSPGEGTRRQVGGNRFAYRIVAMNGDVIGRGVGQSWTESQGMARAIAMLRMREQKNEESDGECLHVTSTEDNGEIAEGNDSQAETTTIGYPLPEDDLRDTLRRLGLSKRERSTLKRWPRMINEMWNSLSRKPGNERCIQLGKSRHICEIIDENGEVIAKGSGKQSAALGMARAIAMLRVKEQKNEESDGECLRVTGTEDGSEIPEGNDKQAETTTIGHTLPEDNLRDILRRLGLSKRERYDLKLWRRMINEMWNSLSRKPGNERCFRLGKSPHICEIIDENGEVIAKGSGKRSAALGMARAIAMLRMREEKNEESDESTCCHMIDTNDGSEIPEGNDSQAETTTIGHPLPENDLRDTLRRLGLSECERSNSKLWHRMINVMWKSLSRKPGNERCTRLGKSRHMCEIINENGEVIAKGSGKRTAALGMARAIAMLRMREERENEERENEESDVG